MPAPANLAEQRSHEPNSTDFFYAIARKALHYSEAFHFPQAIKDLPPAASATGGANLIAA
jgi:hypothetical protein